MENNQGLRKDYQPQPSASAGNPYLDLDYSGFTKTPSNNYYQLLLSKRSFFRGYLFQISPFQAFENGLFLNDIREMK